MSLGAGITPGAGARSALAASIGLPRAPLLTARRPRIDAMLRADTRGVPPSARRVDRDHDGHRVRHPAPVWWASTDSRPPRPCDPRCRIWRPLLGTAGLLSAFASAKPQEDTLRAQPRPRHTLHNVGPVEPRSVVGSLPFAVVVSIDDTVNGRALPSWMMASAGIAMTPVISVLAVVS